MGFNEQVRRDIGNVFFRVGKSKEFSEVALIDGRDVHVMQDDSRIVEDADLTIMGDTAVDKVVYVMESEMPRLPYTGQEIEYNGAKYYVRTAVCNAGVYQIVMSRTQLYY